MVEDPVSRGGVMLKALIVEDELLTRVGLHSLVDWKQLGYELLEDAKDGESALIEIREKRPHVIFLDINIPFISGIELMEKLKQEGIPVKVVVISSFEKYETVRAAMKLGAIDYISKLSLKKDDLALILENIRAEYAADTTGGLGGACYETGEKEENFLAGDRKEYGTKKPPVLVPEEEFEKGICLAISLVIPPRRSSIGLPVLVALCEQFFTGTFRPAGQRYPGNLNTYTASGNETYPSESEACTKDIFSCKTFFEDGILFCLINRSFIEEKTTVALQKEISRILNKDVWIGVGPVWKNVEEREQCIEIAKQIELLRFYCRKPNCTIINYFLPKKKVTDTAIQAFYYRLGSVLEKMECKAVEDTINSIFDLIENTCYLPVAVIRRTLSDLLGIFSRKAQDLGRSIDDIGVNGNNNHYQFIAEAQDLEELRKWFFDFVREYTDILFADARGGKSSSLKKVLSYINENLYMPLQLSEVASFVQVSESHLSSNFKRKMGLSFVTYVHQLKIREAKHLLEQGDLVHKVSERLGYESPSYFSKVFKKQEGISPEQYQRQKIGT
jgi:AraC-like DNA-binding protein/CheY-like chemotaxis protein